MPDALCYPEIYPARYRYAADDSNALKNTLHAWLDGAPPPAPDVEQWTSGARTPAWSRVLQSLHAHSVDG